MLLPYLRLLKKRNFFLLWFGQIISQFGDRLTQMALIGLVYKLEPGSPFSLAKMFSLAVVPVFLISPVAGVYVDRWNKQKTMCVSDFLRGALISSVPFVFFRLHSLIFIYFLIFLSYCAGRFFIPAKMAIIPSLVGREDFFLANSLVSITAMIAAILGFGIGGVIVERWGVRAAFIIDASTFILSASFIFFMRIKEASEFSPKDLIELSKNAFIKVKNSFIFEVREGISYIFRSRDTRYAAKVLFTLFASIGSFYTVLIVFIQNALSTITYDLGWLAVGISVGLFVGSLFYGRFGSTFPLKRIVNLSMMFTSLYLAFFVFFLNNHPFKTFAFLSCVFLGIVSSPIVIAVNTLIHKEGKNNFWGRIFSSLEVIIHLAFIIFMFLSAYLAERFTPFVIIISICIIIFFFSSVNAIRER